MSMIMSVCHLSKLLRDKTLTSFAIPVCTFLFLVAQKYCVFISVIYSSEPSEFESESESSLFSDSSGSSDSSSKSSGSLTKGIPSLPVPSSFICSYCNRTLTRLTDRNNQNESYYCNSCGIDFQPDNENVRRESKLSVPDRNQETLVATTPGQDYLNKSVGL
jgi:predicted RNA-binding Zn-ribbon protein involved in translation (DUF1610 family)